MVRLIPSHVFVKDPVDVWGKEQTIGLAEHAVRVQATPVPFDRRGDMLKWADFESTTKNYELLTVGTPTYGRSTDTKAIGDFSFKCTADTNHNVSMLWYMNDFHPERIGMQAQFATDDSDIYLAIGINYYNGTTVRAPLVRYNFATEAFEYLDSTSNYVSLGTVGYRNKKENFSTIKLVVDFNTNKYIRALIFGTEYDMSDYALPPASGFVDSEVLRSHITITSQAASQTLYIDDIVVTENEPK